ncbi:MAG: hypothetical protein WHT07_02585 [Desulfobaccales bacterium]
MEAAARARAEEAARQAEAERIARLPETSPTYRTTPTPAAAVAEPIPVPEQPSVPPMGDLEADLLREAPLTEPERTARPLDLTGRPMMPPEGRPLVQRLDALFRMVDETGDPRAAQEIHNLLLAHRPEVVEAFRSPDPAVGKGLKPLADRVEALYRKVEETGDVNAARQLHELLAANQQGLTQLNWEHLHRLASQPMTQSAGEIKDLVRDERLAGGEPDFMRRLETLFRRLDEEGDPRAALEVQSLITAHRPEVLRLFSLPEAGESRLGPLATRVEELYRRVEDAGDLDAARQLHELIRQNYHLLSRADRTIAGLAAGPRPPAPEPETIVPEPPPTRGPQVPREPFNLQTTDMPYYDNLLKNPQYFAREKGIVGCIEYMAPDAFLDKAGRTTFDENLVRKYATRVEQGKQMPLPILDIATKTHEGRHRALVAKAMGLELMPVLVVEPITKPSEPTSQTQATPESISEGRQSVAITPTGREVPTRFAVLDVDALVTSHDDLLNENPAFPQELQPRDRTRAASELQISRIENNLRPELLGDNPLASDGAPIVGPDGIVESGNARTIALRRAYKANREQARRYKQWLIDHAAEFGLDPEAIKATQKPVLVRVRQGEVRPEERVVLAREFNLASTAAFSPMEQAQNDARALLHTDILSLFEPNDRGEINTTANAPFIRAFMQRIVSPNELANYYTADGNLNQAGLNRIRNALFAAAYGKSGALELLAERTDDRLRNITGALAMVAPRMAKLEQQIRNGDRFDVGIAPQLAQAAEILQDIREAGLNFEDGLARVKFLGETDPIVVDLLHLFNAYARSRVRLQEVFNRLKNLSARNGSQRYTTGG